MYWGTKPTYQSLTGGIYLAFTPVDYYKVWQGLFLINQSFIPPGNYLRH
jgi:hypothetical protein